MLSTKTSTGANCFNGCISTQLISIECSKSSETDFGYSKLELTDEENSDTSTKSTISKKGSKKRCQKKAKKKSSKE